MPHSLKHRIAELAMEVHQFLGPALPLQVYLQALCHELKHHGISYRQKWPISLPYKDTWLPTGRWLDLIVEGTIGIDILNENNFSARVEAGFRAKLIECGFSQGLILNFNVVRFDQNAWRSFGNFPDPPAVQRPGVVARLAVAS